jgi:signal peptide peptidase SppA
MATFGYTDPETAVAPPQARGRTAPMGWFKRRPVVPVLRFVGPIGMASPLRPGLSLATVAGAIERAFALSKLPTVAVSINSPGGSPVQSHLIYRRIRQLAEERKKKVYVFCEDVAASGGYFLALAGDEIHADPSSIVGSIGVISAGFGLDKAIERLGIQRRVHTSGTSKSFLDPFQPERPDDVARLVAVQREVHDAFIAVVKERRLGKLKAPDAELFSGAFWSGPRAHELGLIDGIGDLRTRMRALHGEKVQLKLVMPQSGGLLRRMLRLSTDADRLGPHGGLVGDVASDAIAALEVRAMWSRYGL